METCNTRKKKKASSIVYFYKSVQHAMTNSVLLMGCLKKTNDAARFQAYGRYRGAAFRVTDDVKTALIQHKALLESGEMKIYGTIRRLPTDALLYAREL